MFRIARTFMIRGVPCGVEPFPCIKCGEIGGIGLWDVRLEVCRADGDENEEDGLDVMEVSKPGHEAEWPVARFEGVFVLDKHTAYD